MLTVRTLLADNNDESADDITAAATDANPEIFLKVFIFMVITVRSSLELLEAYENKKIRE